jgi:hypothetical protein
MCARTYPEYSSTLSSLQWFGRNGRGGICTSSLKANTPASPLFLGFGLFALGNQGRRCGLSWLKRRSNALSVVVSELGKTVFDIPVQEKFSDICAEIVPIGFHVRKASTPATPLFFGVFLIPFPSSCARR